MRKKERLGCQLCLWMENEQTQSIDVPSFLRSFNEELRAEAEPVC